MGLNVNKNKENRICIYDTTLYAYTILPYMHIRFSLYAYTIYLICIYDLPYMHIRFTV